MSSSSVIKEVEWWNEIRPWKNSISDLCDSQTSDDETNLSIRSLPKIKRQRTKISTIDDDPSASVCRTYSGPCPLTFDGAFGLTISQHQLQLCPSTKQICRNICLYQHFHGKHGFTRSNAIRLVQAIIRKDDPKHTDLFSTNSTLFNPHHRVQCPLANQIDENGEKSCLTFDITRKSIRRHLLFVHQLDREHVDELIRTLYK